ncbi:MAG: YqgE/AlgH family protein [Duncaniella sp.]|nr:YqgE/AlgH family protein [Duncaniella sp.]
MSKISDYLFNINIPSQFVPAVGNILVAEPMLRENYFNHAVICIFDHEDRGETLGVVLNNRSGYQLSQLIDGVKEGISIPVFVGGPVATDRLYFLHTLGEIIPDSREIIPGLWIGGDFEAMLKYVNDGYPVDGNMRFFVGYSGWSPGQLSEELSRHVWAVAQPPEAGVLMAPPGDDSLWHELVRRLGPSYRAWRFHPRDTTAN